jgi:hypothetical protein
MPALLPMKAALRSESTILFEEHHAAAQEFGWIGWAVIRFHDGPADGTMTDIKR